MKARVLIADDSVHMRMILKDILVKCGYEVVGEADDGAEAVKLYNELLPDVATIDISMPKMDGIAALKAIRAAHPNAKVVTVGAMNQQNLVIEAVRAGTADFFLKPFQSERVDEALRRALKR